jgi:ribonuclease-3
MTGVFQRLLARIIPRWNRSGEEAPGFVDVPRLQRVLGYRISDTQLFTEALSHRSYLQVSGDPATVSNERLEFLGDSVLNLVVAEYVFRHHPTAPEGELTKMRSRLVNRKALSLYAEELRLAEFMLMSPSASQVIRRGLETILADAFEAVIGAVYLDGGFDHAKQFVERTVDTALRTGLIGPDDENFKSRLLESVQAAGMGVPRYLTVHESGPDHDRTFTVEVYVGNVSRGVGHGKNKKDAEQAAAEQALRKLGMLGA